VAIRPVELLNVKEGDFDLGLGVVNVKHNKEDKPKIVPLLPEDVELIRSLPTGLPHLHFFRHVRRKGARAGDRFGEKYFYKWWIQACNNLGIQGVDLYGGTRHSTVRALRECLTPDQIKRGTMHSTNKAFERYFQIELEDARKVYRAAQGLHKVSEQPEKANVLKLRD
jgi:integrase